MSTSDAVRPKSLLRSIAWKFFKIRDKNRKVAECKYCQKLFSYRASVSNLTKHIKTRHKHPYFREDNSDKYENDEVSAFSLSENEEDDSNNDDPKENNTVKISESTEKNQEEESVCLLCQKTFPEQDSTQMMDHMFKVHNISQIKLVDGNIHLEQEENTSVKFRTSNWSSCWDYFVIQDRKKKLARCKLCGRELSYNSNVSNLTKHLHRQHSIIFKQGQEHIQNSDQLYKPRSAIWSFYTNVNEDRTICACIYCNKEFNVVGGLTNMKRHLVEKHPEALLHHKTNSDPLFMANDENNEGSEEENIQEEYLDFDELDIQNKVIPKPKVERRPSFEPRPNKERKTTFEHRSKLERSSNLERNSKRPRVYRNPLFIKNQEPSLTKAPDTLEHFTNYITSLLQELPEKISKKLQMNFVKQIIEAQISCVENDNDREETVTRINNTVDGTLVNNNQSMSVVESVNEGITIASNESANNDRVVTVSNGIIIRPLMTAP